MSLPFVKLVKNVPGPSEAPGYIKDEFVLDKYQRNSINVFINSLQYEHEAYLSAHPELFAMTSLFIKKRIQTQSSRAGLELFAKYFTRPFEEIDKDIREKLHVPPDVPYHSKPYQYEAYTKDVMFELWKIQEERQADANPVICEETPQSSHNTTKSSSFISCVTSDPTLLTPEIMSERSPTTSEIFFGMISRVVDRATIMGLEEKDLLYDAAYVEVMIAVENAMEMTVVEIKEDIMKLLDASFRFFNFIISEKEQIVAEQNWEKRMRKKLKRTLRRADNFKGYETPPTPKSKQSSHESYKIPPPPPCACHPQFHYNRYPKDRFGIYLPRDEEFCNGNITLTPVISAVSTTDIEQCLDCRFTEIQSQDSNSTLHIISSDMTPNTPTTTLSESTKSEESVIIGPQLCMSHKDAITVEKCTDNCGIFYFQANEHDPINESVCSSRRPTLEDYMKIAAHEKDECSGETPSMIYNTRRLRMLTFTKKQVEDRNIDDDESLSSDDKIVIQTRPQSLQVLQKKPKNKDDKEREKSRYKLQSIVKS